MERLAKRKLKIYLFGAITLITVLTGVLLIIFQPWTGNYIRIVIEDSNIDHINTTYYFEVTNDGLFKAYSGEIEAKKIREDPVRRPPTKEGSVQLTCVQIWNIFRLAERGHMIALPDEEKLGWGNALGGFIVKILYKNKVYIVDAADVSYYRKNHPTENAYFVQLLFELNKYSPVPIETL